MRTRLREPQLPSDLCCRSFELVANAFNFFNDGIKCLLLTQSGLSAEAG